MSDLSDGDIFLDPDASRDYLRSWKERVDQVAANTRAMSGQIEALRVRAEDRNRLAEVTIDASGVLVDLTLTERIHQFAPDVVSRAVMAALRDARAQAAARSREIAVETMGADSLAARTIADRLEQQLRAPEPPADSGRG